VDASERVSRLVETLRREGCVDVADAAAEFGTAEMTIRRDLDLLVGRGVARRVRGGAVSLLMRGEELPFAMREMEAAFTELEKKFRALSDDRGAGTPPPTVPAAPSPAP